MSRNPNERDALWIEVVTGRIGPVTAHELKAAVDALSPIKFKERVFLFNSDGENESPVMAPVCQVNRVNTDLLDCASADSAGVRCERLDPHGEDGHAVGDHTVNHGLMGNGFSCANFPPFPITDCAVLKEST